MHMFTNYYAFTWSNDRISETFYRYLIVLWTQSWIKHTLDLLYSVSREVNVRLPWRLQQSSENRGRDKAKRKKKEDILTTLSTHYTSIYMGIEQRIQHTQICMCIARVIEIQLRRVWCVYLTLCKQQSCICFFIVFLKKKESVCAWICVARSFIWQFQSTMKLETDENEKENQRPFIVFMCKMPARSFSSVVLCRHFSSPLLLPSSRSINH